MSGVSRWRDSGHLERAVETAGGQEAFDAAVAAMLDDARGWRLAEMRKRRGMTQEQVAIWPDQGELGKPTTIVSSKRPFGRETAPWTFHVVGPGGIREVTERETSQGTADVRDFTGNPGFTRTPRRACSTASERASSHPLGPWFAPVRSGGRRDRGCSSASRTCAVSAA
jgi:hypothetical protein